MERFACLIDFGAAMGVPVGDRLLKHGDVVQDASVRALKLLTRESRELV